MEHVNPKFNANPKSFRREVGEPHVVSSGIWIGHNPVGTGVELWPATSLTGGAAELNDLWYCDFRRNLQSAWPVSITQDRSALLLEEVASQLRDLLTQVLLEKSHYECLPDALVMPSGHSKKTTLRITKSEPARFRFVED